MRWSLELVLPLFGYGGLRWCAFGDRGAENVDVGLTGRSHRDVSLALVASKIDDSVFAFLGGMGAGAAVAET